MIVLWIITAIIGLLIILFLVSFLVVLNAHNKMFNKKYIPPKIDSYTKEEYNLDAKKVEIDYKGNNIRGYIYTYGEYDKNKILVFCHGMESTKESYIQEIAYLAHSGFMVIGFDYLGVNESDGLIKGFGDSLLSLDKVINYIKHSDELKSKDIFVVGHSWGGYAATNIVRFHKDIKGVVALAPVVSFKRYLNNNPKYNKIIISILMLIEKIKFGKYSGCDALNSLNEYDGKIMIIQSKNDHLLPFDSTFGYLKNGLKKNAKFIVNDDRYHNPDYKKEAVFKLMAFLNNVSKYSGDELVDFMNKQDFRSMGELDNNVMDEIVNFIK